ncbi:Ig-like domain-containing protein [Treponema zioleckii]|uniref:Ig-like domain-containing protein n=1 Tax=Treponema zioleckii TaxID=331680 RepID=UPI00168AE3B7|nr:Ig-like domain-containing protein [Treponema zioleckii]
MKKGKKKLFLAALSLFATGFLLFNTVACSSGSDDDDNGTVNPQTPESSDTGLITITAPEAAGAVTLVADSDTTTKLYEGTSVQEALEYLMTNSSTGSYTITVAAGTYEEMLFYTGSASITIEGTGTAQYGTDVLISYSNSGNSNAMATLASNHGVTSGYTRGATRFDGKCNLILKNVTIQNSYSRSANDGSQTQAEALVFSSTGNLIAYNSSFLSHQDTLYLGQKGGRMWFYKDYISGDVDFIWGYMDVALFEECSIYCRGDEATKAYIFASRSMTDAEANKGIVIYNNKIEIAEGVTAWYGRNSGDDTQAAILNNTITGSGTLNSTLYQTAPKSYVTDVAGDLAIGYKDYNNTFNGTVVDTSSRLALTGALSERVANREYNGRYAILNRGYSETDAQYKTASTIWDISAYETEFNATEDTSNTNIYVDPVYEKNVVGGNTVQLTPSSDVDGLTYSYASSDESIATVDSNGLVTTVAGADGTATITVTASNGSTDTMSVKVIAADVPATAVNVTLADTSVAKYGVTTATITFEPADASNQSFTLTSADSNVKVFDTATQKLASSTTLEANDGTATVQVWVGGDVTNATLTAKSDAYESATAGTATVSTTAGAVTWGDTCAWRMATDIQKGTYGIYDGLVIDSSKDSPLITDTANTGKMGLKTNSKIQTRNVILYIPVEGASSVVINLVSGSTGCSYYVGESSSNTFTANSDNTVFSYDYDGGTTGIVLGSAISLSGTLQKQAGEGIAANGKYLKVVIARTSSDVNIASITVQKTGEFTATWDVEEQTGASGTYTLSDSTVAKSTALEDGTSSDGFVSWSGLTSNGNDYACTSSSSTVSVAVSGASIITLTGCYNGTNGKTLTVKDSSDNTIVSGVYTSSDQTLSFLYTGEATTLTLSWSGSAYITAVQVSDGTRATESVSAVSVSGASEIAVGATANFTATVSAAYITTDTSVTWSSSDENVATVDSNGVVTAVSAGNATITATSVFDSTKSGSADVTVSATVSDTFEETTTISFGSSGNYKTLSKLDISNVTISDNGGNNSQVKNGYLSFKVKSGAVIDVSSYSGYTSYTLSDGTTTSDTQTGTSYSFTATSDCTITLTAVSTNNYLYSITITYTK